MNRAHQGRQVPPSREVSSADRRPHGKRWRAWFNVEDLILLLALALFVGLAPEDWSWLKTLAVGMAMILLLTLVGDVLVRISGKGKTMTQRWAETELGDWFFLGVDLLVIVLAILAFNAGEVLAGLLFALVLLVNLCLFAYFRRAHEGASRSESRPRV